MASATSHRAGGSVPADRTGGHPAVLWGAFTLVHATLLILCFVSTGWPLGDVERVYRSWAEGAASGEFYVGITTSFVYPLLAFVPMILAYALAPDSYANAWLAIVTILDAVTFAWLLGDRRDRRRVAAAWWWLVFLLVLGPIALARVDSITVPLVIMALLWLQTRPLWGSALLAVATWVKVWPAAVIAALVVTSPRRWTVAAAAAGVSALVVAVSLVLGSGSTVFSFVTQQTGRGIQIEAPVAAPWLWQAAAGSPRAAIYYDRDILTFQVTGQGVEAVAWLMTPLLVAVVVAVLLLGMLATRRGVTFESVFPPLVLALVAALIAVNKVGSPQFITWFAAPVILGLVLTGRAWRTPALLVLVLAILTHAVYPHLYELLLEANPWLILVLTLRNALEFVLLGWALSRLWALGGTRTPPAVARDVGAALTVKE